MRLTEILHCLSVPQGDIKKGALTHIDIKNKKTVADLTEVRAEMKRANKIRDNGSFF